VSRIFLSSIFNTHSLCETEWGRNRVGHFIKGLSKSLRQQFDISINKSTQRLNQLCCVMFCSFNI
jgi:hypothetical protein